MMRTRISQKKSKKRKQDNQKGFVKNISRHSTPLYFPCIVKERKFQFQAPLTSKTLCPVILSLSSMISFPNAMSLSSMISFPNAIVSCSQGLQIFKEKQDNNERNARKSTILFYHSLCLLQCTVTPSCHMVKCTATVIF